MKNEEMTKIWKEAGEAIEKIGKLMETLKYVRGKK